MSCDCKRKSENDCICLTNGLNCTDMCSCKDCRNTVIVESDDNETEYDTEDDDDDDEEEDE